MSGVVDGQAFELRVGRSGATVVLAPRGELDLGTSPELAEALSARAREDVLLDLREVSFIDSSGISAVLEAWRVAQEGPGHLRVVAGPSQVQRVFQMIALDRELDWAEAPAEVSWQADRP